MRARLLPPLLAVFPILAASCPGGPTGPTVLVAYEGCRAEQLEYGRAGLQAMDGVNDQPWREVAGGEAPTYTVRCVELADAEPGAGGVTIGARDARIDPARANGLFAFAGVQNHELGHLRIADGPHPERAKSHVCAFDGQTAECAPGIVDRNALMVPLAEGLGTPTASPWSGNTERVEAGAVTQHVPQWSDHRFFEWALTP